MVEILFFVIFLPTVALVAALLVGLLMAGAVVGVGEHLEERAAVRRRFERVPAQPAARPAPAHARAA